MFGAIEKRQRVGRDRKQFKERLEKVDRRICLDTDACISILNNEERSRRLIDKIESDEIYISMVTLFELLMRETNLDIIETLRSSVSVLDFDENASGKQSLFVRI